MYFVVINHPDGKRIWPLIDEFEDVVIFASIKEAEDCANKNGAACAYGYEIFKRGKGIQK